MKYSKKYGVFLLALFFAIILCSTASAANTTNATTDVNSSIASLNASTAIDPVISGKVIESPSNSDYLEFQLGPKLLGVVF